MKDGILITAGLVAGNFVYQLMFPDTPDWATAVDRSFFQVTAIVIYAIATKK